MPFPRDLWRNQGHQKLRATFRQLLKVSGPRWQHPLLGESRASSCSETHLNANQPPLPQTTAPKRGSRSLRTILLPGEYVSNKTYSKGFSTFFSWSIYRLKCAKTLVRHMKGRNWVNVNAEQPPAQAEISRGDEGPDLDLEGAQCFPECQQLTTHHRGW